jgi:YHS domain-containing protein
MNDVITVIWHGIEDSFLMAWEVWWALVLGFAISAIVQAWVPRERIESALSGSGPKPIALATGLGAASSSCSYAAIAIAKSLFQKGASAASALAFQFASTNLVWELGLVLWVLIGWQFTLAEYIGGILMIGLMVVLLRVFVPRRLEEQARQHAQQADTDHQHHTAAERLPWRQRLTSVRAWSDVAHNFRGDWQMVWKEVTLGFFLAGFIAQLGDNFFNGLFIRDAPPALTTVENVIVGPVIAVLSFVCSVGNVPLAAVLWSGGISFAGVMAFIFADLIVLPIIAIYRKYYGWQFAMRITALMFLTMALAALAIDGLFSLLGLIPSGPRPTRSDIFGSIQVDYKLFLNVLGLVVFAALFWLTQRRGATDPVCGMKVDRAKAVTKTVGGETFYFCSQHCLHAFELDPQQYAHTRGRAAQPGMEEHVGGLVAGDGGQATDPVCGMAVDPATALHADHNHHRYYFCCAGCRERFQENPEHFAAGQAAAPTHRAD